MKTSIKFILSAIALLIISISIICYDNSVKHTVNHICIDPTHKTCDGNCECDGMECNN